ncbi:DUF982 domain-containing protein [Sinorhizobium terangae]|uniref:DUF982 domain-containing protein n=1 Tax=Sinorhizobium terangae TaxID=110322 RepID=A0A6N7LIA2_SINTE|nr:DUF982 domain-containing protein [Sinorhizobium terangae]MQX17512.1 DUF982 domain-containing protein [Sinorhizobium terangae]WFU46296.1 DUF982 domain-containing protein [Sinorhizobium terangae]
MSAGPWSECVVVRSGDGTLVFVSTTSEALAMLQEAWPRRKGPAYHAAVSACEEVLSGHLAPYVARIAFLDASREAGIAVAP